MIKTILRPVTLVWLASLVLLSIAAVQAQPAESEQWVYALAAFAWAWTLAHLIPSPLATALHNGFRWTRSHMPALAWLILLIAATLLVSLWLVPYQPTNGRALLPIEWAYLAWVGWLAVYWFAYDLDGATLQALGARLGTSRLTGVLVTLTTVWLLFFGAEAYLRIFYITTDGYGFTAMNYHWYNNFYWGHYNSLGFRDYEPLTDTPDAPLTRIAVVGDSFAAGHGINDIDQSFPQMLRARLGTGYDVNLVASSGWDADVYLDRLQQYPLRPQIAILSYYLNDIDWLMAAPELNPDARNFDFIDDPNLHWFVLNYFVPNFIYYNLIQFTSPARASGFAYDLIGAHTDEALWSQQAVKLTEFADWTRSQGIDLIVLVWPHLGMVEASLPATARVGDFFRVQGVPVVDMTPIVQDEPVMRMIVNRYDTHPSPEAHALAADALYDAVRDLSAAR